MELNDESYIREMRHIRGPWNQYDFLLAARGYGWAYVIDSANYVSKADLMNIGTLSLSLDQESEDIEYVDAYRENGSDIASMDELQKEGSMLGLGGASQALDGAPLKIVWINQTNLIRLMTPIDDEELMTRYAETLIRRSFNSEDAMKLARPYGER